MPLRRAITTEWSLEIDEDFAHRIEDRHLIFWKPGRTLYLDIWNLNPDMSQEETFNRLLAITNPKPLLTRGPSVSRGPAGCDLYQYGYVLLEQEQGSQRYAFYGIRVAPTSVAQSACYFDSRTDLDWADDTWRFLDYRRGARTHLVHRRAHTLPRPATPGIAKAPTVIDPFQLERATFEPPVDRPALQFRLPPELHTAGEPVLITDPIYLADVYNDPGPLAACVREQGLIVNRFGGDLSAPVWWQPPYLMLLLAEHPEEADPPLDATIVPEVVGCDSGSFVFLPLSERIPQELKAKIDAVVACRNGVIVPIPAGLWSFWYEYGRDVDHWPCKIVARWEPDEEDQPRLPLFD
jgi:hypothetical protein